MGWLFSLISALLGGIIRDKIPLESVQGDSGRFVLFPLPINLKTNQASHIFLEIVKTWLAKGCPFLEASAVISTAYFEQGHGLIAESS